jgi:hypothetical protein
MVGQKEWRGAARLPVVATARKRKTKSQAR